LVTVAALLLVAGGCSGPAAPPAPTAAQPCPQWTEFPADPHSNRDSPYLGCANTLNLRSMVENPLDLERGRPLGPAQAERAMRAIEAYQQGKTNAGKGSGAPTPTIVMSGGTSAGGQ
jgi:type IV pilus biogenesis protein CpaD/CtpE